MFVCCWQPGFGCPFAVHKKEYMHKHKTHTHTHTPLHKQEYMHTHNTHTHTPLHKKEYTTHTYTTTPKKKRIHTCTQHPHTYTHTHLPPRNTALRLPGIITTGRRQVKRPGRLRHLIADRLSHLIIDSLCDAIRSLSVGKQLSLHFLDVCTGQRLIQVRTACLYIFAPTGIRTADVPISECLSGAQRFFDVQRRAFHFAQVAVIWREISVVVVVVSRHVCASEVDVEVSVTWHTIYPVAATVVACTYVCVCVCMYVYLYIYIYIYIYIYVYIYVCMHACICMCVYMRLM